MKEIYLFIKILFTIFSATTILGMIKPWWVLWFLDHKNRITVLKYYGSLSALMLVALLLINLII